MCEIASGFQIDWVMLFDNDKDAVMWTSNVDLSDPSIEHEIRLPADVRQCQTISREIGFSTLNEIENLKLLQKVMFKNRCLEQWVFEFGPVEAKTSNVWQNILKAAPESSMMPNSKILNGNVVIESKFLNGDECFLESRARLFYDNDLKTTAQNQ